MIEPADSNLILDIVTDLVNHFLDYDREDHEDLVYGGIEAAIQHGNITIDEIVDRFRVCLEEHLGESPDEES